MVAGPKIRPRQHLKDDLAIRCGKNAVKPLREQRPTFRSGSPELETFNQSGVRLNVEESVGTVPWGAIATMGIA